MSTAAVTDTLRHPCPAKTRSDLEYDRVLGALASCCVSEMGRALARDLPFARTRAEARLLLEEAHEAAAAIDAAPV